jgi:hypothetical protein
VVKSGRALLFPVFKGMYERRDGFDPGVSPPAALRDHMIDWSKDLGRSLDYLDSRGDIGATKIAFLGDSAGTSNAAPLLAIELRFKAAVLLNGGLPLRRLPPETDPFNFARHVRLPVLLLGGRYDGTSIVEEVQTPMFQMLGTPDRDKKHVIFETGHDLPRPEEIREILDWLDQYLGPVRR